jgi:hypothetical protein
MVTGTSAGLESFDGSMRLEVTKDESEEDKRLMNLERKVRAGWIAGGVNEMSLSMTKGIRK